MTDTETTNPTDRPQASETLAGHDAAIAAARRQRRTWYLVGGVAIAAFLLFGANAFRENLTPYVSVAEAKSSPARVQVAGSLVPGSNQYLEESQELRFDLVDEEGQQMTVAYRGTTPGNFEEASQIVVMGSYRTGGDAGDGLFRAESLLTKCPSKYQGMQEPE